MSIKLGDRNGQSWRPQKTEWKKFCKRCGNIFTAPSKYTYIYSKCNRRNSWRTNKK